MRVAQLSADHYPGVTAKQQTITKKNTKIDNQPY